MAGSTTSVKAKIEEAGSKIPHNTQHFVAGISGGLGSTVALYPLELLKIRMQVIEGSTSPYRSLYGSFSTVLRQEGFKGFYNGVTPAIIASAASWGGFFYFYEYCKAMKLHGGKSETGVFDHVSVHISLDLDIFLPYFAYKRNLHSLFHDHNTALVSDAGRRYHGTHDESFVADQNAHGFARNDPTCNPIHWRHG
jgi:hypothetical protein